MGKHFIDPKSSEIMSIFQVFHCTTQIALFWPKLLPALFLTKPWYPCPFEIQEETLRCLCFSNVLASLSMYRSAEYFWRMTNAYFTVVGLLLKTEKIAYMLWISSHPVDSSSSRAACCSWNIQLSPCSKRQHHVLQVGIPCIFCISQHFTASSNVARCRNIHW
jgi:hypothetical protein